VSRGGRDQLKDVFYRGLDSRSKNLADSRKVLVKLIKYEDILVEGENLAKPLEEAPYAKWKEMIAAVIKMEKRLEDTSDEKEIGVFLILYSQVVIFYYFFPLNNNFCCLIQIGLQLLSEPAASIDMLTELKPVYVKFEAKKKSVGGSEPHRVEVVVEILLSFLSQNHHLLRKVVSSVFTVICPHLTLPAIDSILAVINTGEGGEEEEGEDSEVDDEGDDEESEDEEAEIEDEEAEKDGDDTEDEEVVDAEHVAKVCATL